MDNVLELHNDLATGTYRHSPYYAFKISDPKPRDIHKAVVRDRLLHHAICRILYPFFERTWIFDSYSCRENKGTHRAMARLKKYAAKVSRNHTRTCWVLKCDIRKFFASIDHQILFEILRAHGIDQKTAALLEEVVGSFESTGPGKGLPLGNLTSQLLVNVYMNEFDQFMKQRLKTRYYIRYADDFLILSHNRKELEALIPKIASFLETNLKLSLHPKKISISTFASGVDFLGWVHFPDHRVLRTASRRRMERNLAAGGSTRKAASYRGLLSYGNTFKIRQKLSKKLSTYPR